MIKLLPYQENFILSLVLLYAARFTTSHLPLVLIFVSLFLLVIFSVTLINFMFLHDDDYTVIAYLLMMLQTISVIRMKKKQHRMYDGGKANKVHDEKFNRICCVYLFCVSYVPSCVHFTIPYDCYSASGFIMNLFSTPIIKTQTSFRDSHITLSI